MYFLDTHIVAWLYQKEMNLFSKNAIQLINEQKIYISPMVELELAYLFEIGKISKKAKVIIDYLKTKIDLLYEDINFGAIVSIAKEETWTRDPFDRLIVSHAKYKDAFLITKDRFIKQNYYKAIF